MPVGAVLLQLNVRRSALGVKVVIAVAEIGRFGGGGVASRAEKAIILFLRVCCHHRRCLCALRVYRLPDSVTVTGCLGGELSDHDLTFLFCSFVVLNAVVSAVFSACGNGEFDSIVGFVVLISFTILKGNFIFKLIWLLTGHLLRYLSVR